MYKGNAKISVIGVGGGGNNAVDRMIDDKIEGINFIAANTDNQVLHLSKAPMTLQLGEKLTKGLGAGGDPEVGRKAAEENRDDIRKELEGADMVFVTAGMGGGTGTGAAPIIAQVAKEMGILTIGVVTKPFHFEMKKRMRNALTGIDELKKYVDTLVVIPNQKLIELAEKEKEDISFIDALKRADAILSNGVQGITELITKPGIINLDFADIKSTMLNKGIAHIGIGRASGKNKAEAAAMMAINSPLLEISVEGARNILVSVVGDPSLGLLEAQKPPQIINDIVNEDAELIYGATINEDLNDEIIVTVIATGFERDFSRTPVNVPPAEAQKPVAEQKTELPKINEILDTETPIDLPVFLQNRKKR